MNQMKQMKQKNQIKFNGIEWNQINQMESNVSNGIK